MIAGSTMSETAQGLSLYIGPFKVLGSDVNAFLSFPQSLTNSGRDGRLV